MIVILILIVVAFSLVNTGIVVPVRLIGIAVLVVILLALVVTGIIVARLIIVRIRRIVPGRIWVIITTIVRGAIGVGVRGIRVRPQRIKADIEDHPRSVKEMTSVAVPPVIAVAVPITMPVRRTLGEDVVSPVSTKMVVSIPELDSGISLVPDACGALISVTRKSRETLPLIRLSDGCRSEWTRARKRRPITIDRRLAKPSRPVRTHSK